MKIELEHILRLGILKDIQEMFYELTGMNTIFFSFKKGGGHYFFSDEKRALFCQIIQSDPEGERRCYLSNMKGAQKAQEKGSFHIYPCHAGLIDIAIPLMVKKEVVGVILTGQILTKTPTQQGFSQVKERTKDLNIDFKRLEKAYFQLKVFPKKKLGMAMKLLTLISDYIIERENTFLLLEKLIKQQKRLLAEARSKRELREKLRKAMPFLRLENNFNEELNRSQRKVKEAKHFIETNFNHPLTLKEVAEAVSLTPNYFCSLFKKYMNCTFEQYLLRTRMEKAEELLQKTAWSIKKICHQVGYDDPNYFSRLFKKTTGFSPTEYRKNRLTKAYPLI